MSALTYLLVRRLTRRLEALRDRVRSLGEGDFEARVDVDGDDEIGELARSFNRSAERIARLMSANQSLLANSSHELRSPLTRMRLALELLGERHAGVESDTAYREIRRSLTEIDQIIDELLISSQLQATATIHRAAEPVALAPIVEQEIAHAAPRLATLLPAGPAGPAGPSGSAIAAAVDPVLFRRVVRNLLENAVKYGDGQPVTVMLTRDGGGVELRVADLGLGVPEGERERIFEPFYRRRGASEDRGGVGLGLALVRQIARLHGGNAHCEPNQPHGSVFVCQLSD
ncbi:MAG: ATP-binding protein [Lautropia sp.]